MSSSKISKNEQSFSALELFRLSLIVIGWVAGIAAAATMAEISAYGFSLGGAWSHATEFATVAIGIAAVCAIVYKMVFSKRAH